MIPNQAAPGRLFCALLFLKKQLQLRVNTRNIRGWQCRHISLGEKHYDHDNRK
jgi:hypothetical protein